jgi:hypothetical protein
MRESRPLHDHLNVPVGALLLREQEEQPKKQKRKKMTAQTIAQVGIFWMVLDMSVNIQWASRVGHVPLGVTTHVVLTPISPIVTNMGSCQPAPPTANSLKLPPRLVCRELRRQSTQWSTERHPAISTGGESHV